MEKSNKQFWSGTLSSRGQIVIPKEVRCLLDFQDKEPIVFLIEGESLQIQKMSEFTKKRKASK